jgi:hypothetical protein
MIQWICLLLAVGLGLSAGQSLGVLLQGSTYQLYSSNDSVTNFTRLSQNAALHAPYGTAIYGNSSSRLLSGTVNRALCEWDLQGELERPLRCVQLSTVPRDLVYMPHPRYPYVLIAVPEQNTVLALDYTSFQLDSAPWYSAAQNPQFLSPTALEYDSDSNHVYVALESSDCIMRFSSDGRLLDGAWALLPRPRFLVLDRHTPPTASLYVLTSDLSLPELYRFRLSDGSSLSTLANLDGDWYPNSLHDSLASIALDDSGILYALWTHADGITAFSMQNASALQSVPLLLDSLWNPVAMIRQETQGGSNIELVVDQMAWYDTNNTQEVFEACTPGVASGATLDGSSISTVWQCPRENSTGSLLGAQLVVTDSRSVYRLVYNGQSALCFDRYLVHPSLSWNLSGSALSSDGDLLVSAAPDRRKVYRVQRACDPSDPADPVLLVNRSLDLCPPTDHCVYFSPQVGVLCMLAATQGGTISCTNGMFSPLQDINIANILMQLVGVSFRGQQLWLGLRNGTALSFTWPDLQLYNQEDPADARNVTYLGFTMDTATGAAVWLLSATSRIPAYVWTSSLYPPAFYHTRASPSGARQQMVLPALAPFSSQWALSHVSPTLFPTEPSSAIFNLAFVALIGLCVMLLLLVCLVCCVWFRRSYRKQGDSGASIKYHNLNDDDTRLPSHLMACLPVRSFLRRSFCCLQCCYDPERGLLHWWAGYWCLGGDSKRDRERRRKKKSEMELSPPAAGSNPFAPAETEGQTPPASEPFVAGSSATLQSIPI